MLPLDAVVTWEGIRSLCDLKAVREPNGRVCLLGMRQAAGVLTVGSFGVRREPPRATKVPAGALVYTRDAWWAPWRERLIRQKAPFTLVSNFHDSVITQRAVDEIRAEGSAVRAWFGVQVGTTDPRVVAMPVGCERETVAAMQGVTRRAWRDRDVLLYLNFKRRNPEREAVWEQFPWAVKDGWAVDGTPRYVETLGRAKFVLSPPGRGWDCYRTYEAMAMGAVPIVRRERPFSDGLEDMPALLVDDWREVTQDRLESYQPQGNTERLTLAYWAQRITGVRHGTDREITHARD